MRRLLALVLLAASLPALALAKGWETQQPVVMYDAPSEEARPMLILTGGFPLKEVSGVHGWYKVASYNGDIGWVAAKDLQRSRQAVVVADRAAIRTDPNAAAAAVFFARRGVVLEVLAGNSGNAGWLKVVHEDGEVGFLLETDSWLNFK